MRPQFIWIVSCFVLLFNFQSKAQVQTIPFTDDFEGPVLWTSISDSGSLSNWELGNPNFGFTNSTHSFQNAWDIDLNSGYTAGAKCNLYSPFFDFTDVINPTLSMKMVSLFNIQLIVVLRGKRLVQLMTLTVRTGLMMILYFPGMVRAGQVIQQVG